jgi:hypothetical protein
MEKDVEIKFADIGVEEEERFAGQHVAIVEGKVEGWGSNVKEAFDMARRKLPQKGSEEVLLRFIPQEGLLIL